MKKILKVYSLIDQTAELQNGVFSRSDLRNLINPKNDSLFYRILSDLQDAGRLKRFCRNFYVSEQFDLWTLSQRLCPESYISFGNILADCMLIGSVPKYRIMAVKNGPSRSYEFEGYTIEHLKITPGLFTGFDKDCGINKASPEKAVLDTLYYYQKGRKYTFDVYSDIDYSALDRVKFDQLLECYKNPKFREFVNGVLDD